LRAAASDVPRVNTGIKDGNAYAAAAEWRSDGSAVKIRRTINRVLNQLDVSRKLKPDVWNRALNAPIRGQSERRPSFLAFPHPYDKRLNRKAL
jgi:hypothetical protein